MEAEHPDQAAEHEDERATQPPGEAGGDAGSQGNPDVDEEALSHRQQEEAASEDSD